MTTQDTMCQNKKEFIRLYPIYGTVGETLKAIGIKSRKTLQNWRDGDPKFNEIYQKELVPNRRDLWVGLLHKIATNQDKTAICPICQGSAVTKTGKDCYGCKGKGWVEVHQDNAQLTALFGLLKSTDHLSDDGMVFQEKHQLELGTKDNKALPIAIVEVGQGDSSSSFISKDKA